MKLKYLLTVVMLILTHLALAQGIRKHYTELTENERLAYKAATDAVIDSGIHNQYVGYHLDPDQDGSNGTMTGTPPIHGHEIFFPWHRQFILGYEQELQSENNNITIPYWDWTGESDPIGVNSEASTSPIWENTEIANLAWSDNFLGSYDSSLNLGRTLNGPANLPNTSQLNVAFSYSSFADFLSYGEALHNKAHQWVEGLMGSMSSPTDPVFYLHHSMVDKIWQDWHLNGGTSSFTETDMPTYDGNTAGFPAVNPNDIIDSRSFGIFYSDAIAQKTTLDGGYSVSNQHNAIEKFIYQYLISAEHFIVPSGNHAEFISSNKIVLKPDFHAEEGGSFTAKISEVGNSPLRLSNESAQASLSNSSSVYPNPFSKQTTIRYQVAADAPVRLSVFNNMGQEVRVLENKIQNSGTHEAHFDASTLPPGLYFYHLTIGKETLSGKMILSQ